MFGSNADGWMDGWVDGCRPQKQEEEKRLHISRLLGLLDNSRGEGMGEKFWDMLSSQKKRKQTKNLTWNSMYSTIRYVQLCAKRTVLKLDRKCETKKYDSEEEKIRQLRNRVKKRGVTLYKKEQRERENQDHFERYEIVTKKNLTRIGKYSSMQALVFDYNVITPLSPRRGLFPVVKIA